MVVVVEENKFPKSDDSHFECLNHQSHDYREDASLAVRVLTPRFCRCAYLVGA